MFIAIQNYGYEGFAIGERTAIFDDRKSAEQYVSIANGEHSILWEVHEINKLNFNLIFEQESE